MSRTKQKKYKTYPKYKDSEVGWLGEIPEEWETMKFKFLAETKYKAFCDGDWVESKDQVESGVYKLIQLKNIGVGKIIPGLDKEITTEFFTHNNCRKLINGDLLIARIPEPILRTALFDDKYGGCITVVDVAVLSCKQGVIPKFLMHLMNSAVLGGYGESLLEGSTRQRVSRNKIGNIKILIPPIRVQNRIANFLDQKTVKIDKLIQKNKKLSKLLAEKRQATITQAVTCGIDKNGNLRQKPKHLPAPGWKDSGEEWIRVIPEGWEVKKLKYLVNKIGSGITPRGGSTVYKTEGFLLIRSQNIFNDCLRMNNIVYIDKETHDSMSNSHVTRGDILLNITGASIGRCYYYDKDTVANVNQHVCIVRPNELMDTKYLHLIMISQIGSQQIDINLTGSGREGLNFEALGNFVIALPEPEKQRSIVKNIKVKLLQIEDLMKTLTMQNKKLEEYRQALISNVVTGKVKVYE